MGMKTGSSYSSLFQRPKISIFYTFHYNKAVGIAIEGGMGFFCGLPKKSDPFYIPMLSAAAEKGALILALTGRLCKGFAWTPRAGVAHALLAEIRA